MAKRMKRCYLCGRWLELDSFVAAQCLRCEKLSDFGLTDVDVG